MPKKLIYILILICSLYFSHLDAQEIDSRWQKIDASIKTLEKRSPGSIELAKIYYKAGRYKSNFNSLAEGHEYYYKAIRIYENYPNQQDDISLVYYMIASDYLQTLDERGLEKVVKKLKELGEQTQSITCRYGD